jgi:tryptophan halogenase
VYSDDFISQREAHKEMEKYVKHKIRDAKHFKFEAGRLEKFWDKNCCAIGLSSNFVEPLEATSIGSSIQQAFALVAMLPSNDYNRYNEIMVGMYDNIVDYIVAHYLVRRDDTPFWKEIKHNLKIPDSLQSNLDMWKNRLPHNSDIYTPFCLFYANNYIPILYGLGWFDIDAINREYQMFPSGKAVVSKILKFASEYKEKPYVSHKAIIESFGLS